MNSLIFPPVKRHPISLNTILMKIYSSLVIIFFVIYDFSRSTKVLNRWILILNFDKEVLILIKMITFISTFDLPKPHRVSPQAWPEEETDYVFFLMTITLATITTKTRTRIYVGLTTPVKKRHQVDDHLHRPRAQIVKCDPPSPPPSDLVAHF